MRSRSRKTKLLKSLLSLAVVSALVCIIGAGTSPAFEPKDVVGIWTFDEPSGAAIGDSSGNGHDGSVNGKVNRVAGKFGTALEFPGDASGSATVPHDDSQTLKTFSITIWVKTTVRNCKTLITKEEPNGVGNFMMFVAGNGSIIFEFWSAKAWFGVGGNTPVDDDKWHHVGATYDKKSMKVYIDGVMEGEQAATADPDVIATALRFGLRHGDQCPLKGSLDDVGLFNVALSDDDIKTIMNDGLSSTSAVSPSSKIADTWGSIKAGD